MKTQLNKVKRMKQLAGLINENQLNESLDLTGKFGELTFSDKDSSNNVSVYLSDGDIDLYFELTPDQVQMVIDHLQK